MSKTISRAYQAKKQKVKDILDLKTEDRKTLRFGQDNLGFPVVLLTDRFAVGLTTFAFKEIMQKMIKEGEIALEGVGHILFKY